MKNGPKKNRIRNILNYETVSYLIAGVMTTAVDYVVFILVNEKMQGSGRFSAESSIMAATAVSWIAAVLFAYLVNKLAVFRNYNLRPRHLLREAAGFFAARAVSGALVFVFMWVMTGPLLWNEYVAKVLTSVFNMVFNYVASKVWIFKK